MRFRFIEAQKAYFPVSLMCRILRISRAGYYAWRVREPSARARADQKLMIEVKAAHRASRGTYGSPRVHRELNAQGHTVGRHRVARLMRVCALTRKRRRRFRITTQSNHAHPIAENALERRFEVEQPNQAWVTDITYVWTLEGWLYLATIIDLYSRRVVGWSMSKRIDQALTLRALSMALKTRTPQPELMHHSDRGSQYAARAYRKMLDAHGITASMSRKGNCWDNAVAESFFATLKVELVYESIFRTRTQAKAAIFEYIEAFYNRVRRHSYLDYVSPDEFENNHESLLAAA